jgi:WD40 repeat protein
MARIAARIRRTEPYLLISQDVSEHRKTLIAAWSAVTLIVASASVAGLLFVSERASRRSAELRLADSLVFQSREDVSRRQWTQALSNLERARATYLALGRSTLLADFGEWLVRRVAWFPLRTQRFEGKRFSAVAFDCASQAVVAGDQSGQLISWDLRTGEAAALPARHAARVTDIRIAGTRMFSAGYDGRVLEWDLAPVPPAASSVPLPFNKPISAFDISSDAGILYLGLADGSIAAFRRDNRHLVSWPAHSGVITGLRTSDGDRLLVSVSKDNRLRIWQRASGGWRRTSDIRQAGPIQDVGVLRELGWAFTANANGSVATVDVATGSEVRAPNALLEGAMSLAISPSGGHGATGDFSGTVRVWDIATGPRSRNW